MPSEYKGIHNNTHSQWWRDPCLRKNVIWMGVCALCTVYTGFDGSLYGGLQAMPKWFEKFPALRDPNTLGLVSSSAAFPGLIMPLIGAWSGDKFGRRVPNIVAAIGIVAFAITQGLSNTLAVFAAARVMISVFNAFSSPTAPALLVEIAHPRYRAVASALNLCCYYIGAIIGAWASYGTFVNFPESHWCWRLPCMLQFLMPSIVLVGFMFVPESPRWLIANGKVDEARRVLARNHANGDEDDPLVMFEMDEIQQAIEDEKTVNRNAGSWFSLFSTPGNRKRMFIVLHVVLGAQFSGNGVVGFYFVPILNSVGITSSRQQLLFNSGINVWNFFLATGAALNVERLGRRKLFLTSTVGMCLSLSVVMACSATFARTASTVAGGTVCAFLFIFYGFYDIAMTPLNIAYNVEILPYAIRSKGMGVWQLLQGVVVVINNYVNPVALDRIKYWFYLVFIAVLVYLTLIIYFVFPETRGLTLEEVAVKFDGTSLNQFLPAAEVSEDNGKDEVYHDGKKVIDRDGAAAAAAA